MLIFWFGIRGLNDSHETIFGVNVILLWVNPFILFAEQVDIFTIRKADITGTAWWYSPFTCLTIFKFKTAVWNTGWIIIVIPWYIWRCFCWPEVIDQLFFIWCEFFTGINFARRGIFCDGDPLIFYFYIFYRHSIHNSRYKKQDK